jgi:Co/Zn/Cd efflux system component
MTVDCVSYLINCLAERMKHSTNHEHENNDNHDSERLSACERRYRKKMKLLILELAPPFLSVTTLIAVTVVAIRQAIQIIIDTNPDDKVTPPNLGLMLLFSALNGVLDAVNVLCFAKAEQGALAKGITSVIHPNEYVCEQQQHHHQHDKHCHKRRNGNDGDVTLVSEKTHLLVPSNDDNNPTPTLLGNGSATDATTDSDIEDASSSSDADQSGLNLNMCSAWTHICADTLRSIAVLLAAGIASLFPQQLSPADADSYGAIVVSIIIIISLGPLIEGLYFTAWEIYYLQREHSQRQKHTSNPEDAGLTMSV